MGEKYEITVLNWIYKIYDSFKSFSIVLSKKSVP